MVKNLLDKNVFIYVMGGLCIFGILIKIVVNFIYKRLISASDNMAASNNKLVKLMRMKFEACYKLKIGVNNVDTFVDKYVYGHKFCGIHLYTWENIGGQVLLLCLAIGVISSGLGIYYECGRNEILLTFFTGLLTGSLLIIVDSFLNMNAKRLLLKINAKDYFENFLKIRLEQQYFTPELLEKYQKEYFRAGAAVKKEPDIVVKEYRSKEHEKQEALHEADLENMNPYIDSVTTTAASSAEADRRSHKAKRTTPVSSERTLEEEKIIEEILKEYLA